MRCNSPATSFELCAGKGRAAGVGERHPAGQVQGSRVGIEHQVIIACHEIPRSNRSLRFAAGHPVGLDQPDERRARDQALRQFWKLDVAQLAGFDDDDLVAVVHQDDIAAAVKQAALVDRASVVTSECAGRCNVVAMRPPDQVVAIVLFHYVSIVRVSQALEIDRGGVDLGSDIGEFDLIQARFKIKRPPVLHQGRSPG